MAAFRDGVAAFRDGVAAFRHGVAAFRDGVAVFRDAVAAFRRALAAFRDGVAAFRRRLTAFRRGQAAFSCTVRGMAYDMDDLVEVSGLQPRTIRRYIELGLLPKPDGNGPASIYKREHVVRVVAIARMRADGMTVADIIERVGKWSLKRFERFVEETNPKKAAPEPAPTPPAEEPSQLEAPAPRDEKPLALPTGTTRVEMMPLLPGLFLMMDGSVPPVVRRIAAEICERYGQGAP